MFLYNNNKAKMSLGQFGLIDISQDAGSKVITIGTTDKNSGEILMKDAGITAQLLRAQRSLAMLKDPATEWAKYIGKLDTLATAHGKSVNEDYKLLSDAGFSNDIAQALAKQKNTRALLDSKALLEFEYPYANDFDTMAGAQAKLGHNVHMPGLKSSVAQGAVEQQTKRRRKLKGKK